MKLCNVPVLLGLVGPIFAFAIAPRAQNASLEACPGYAATNVHDDGSKVTADLRLAGPACNVYGDDLTDLKLEVEYQTGGCMFQRPARHR